MIKLNKPKSIWVFYTIILLGVIAAFLIVMICENANPILVAMAGFIMGIIGIRVLVSQGRTIILDSHGCEVRFWRYKKMYKWSDFIVKRVEVYDDRRLDTIVSHVKCIVLAPYDIYKKGRWKPDLYSNFIHPLSVVYIYLFPQKILEKSEKQLREYLGYVVEEECFWKKIQEWGVDITK